MCLNIELTLQIAAIRQNTVREGPSWLFNKLRGIRMLDVRKRYCKRSAIGYDGVERKQNLERGVDTIPMLDIQRYRERKTEA